MWHHQAFSLKGLSDENFGGPDGRRTDQEKILSQVFLISAWPQALYAYVIIRPLKGLTNLAMAHARRSLYRLRLWPTWLFGKVCLYDTPHPDFPPYVDLGFLASTLKLEE